MLGGKSSILHTWLLYSWPNTEGGTMNLISHNSDIFYCLFLFQGKQCLTSIAFKYFSLKFGAKVSHSQLHIPWALPRLPLTLACFWSLHAVTHAVSHLQVKGPRSFIVDSVKIHNKKMPKILVSDVFYRNSVQFAVKSIKIGWTFILFLYFVLLTCLYLVCRITKQKIC